MRKLMATGLLVILLLLSMVVARDRWDTAFGVGLALVIISISDE